MVHTHGEDDRQRAIWDGNRSVLLLLTTLFLLWFIFHMGIPLLNKSVAHGIHITVALIFALTCAWNMFHTPSHGKGYRKAHRVSGWCAMIAGAVTLLTGVTILVQFADVLPRANKIVFCITGTLQIILQLTGLYMIRILRKPSLHRKAMTVMFYTSLLMPAVNRFPDMIGWEHAGSAWTFGTMPLGALLAFFAILFQEMALQAEGKQAGNSDAGSSEDA
mmetsp:Transcript_472/g.597  ORF Transcript_472/g.597 Transcript_472/m.597 type:complete len:219 (+) Transcript_472:140-796(+)